MASGAEHLGQCYTCPLGEVIAYGELIDRVLTEYRCLKRLGCRCDETVPLCYLLAVDEEVEALRALEIEREVKLREAQRAAERGRRR